MFHYYNLNREDFLRHYHQRSNAESTFSMVKAKFRDSVRSTTDVAMKNEVLCKMVCHNLVSDQRHLRTRVGGYVIQPRVGTSTGWVDAGARMPGRVNDFHAPEGPVARSESRGSRRRVVYVTGSAACLLVAGGVLGRQRDQGGRAGLYRRRRDRNDRL